MSSKVLHYCICQPRSKPDRVPTEDYCFNHRRFVCDNCICDEINNRHVNCIVGNYSDWLHSKNRKHSISLKSENKCPLCNDVLNDNPMQVIRIGCKCVYHSKCLREYILFNKNENMDDILCVECGKSISNSYILSGNTNLAKQTRKFLTLIGKEKKSLLSNANSKNEYLKLQDKNRFANVRYEPKRNDNDLSNNNDNNVVNSNNSNNVNDNGLSLHNNNDEFDRNFDNFENGARESENERETERERHMHDNNDSHNHNDSVIETQPSLNNTLNMNNFNNSNNEAQASGQAPSVVVDTMPSVPRTRHTHAHSQRHSDTNGTGYGTSQTGLHGASSVRRMSRINRPLHRSKQSGFFGGRLPKQQSYTVLLILAVLLQIVFLYMIFANNNDSNSAKTGNSGTNNVNLNTIDKSQLADILGQARMEKLNLKNKMIP